MEESLLLFALLYLLILLLLLLLQPGFPTPPTHERAHTQTRTHARTHMPAHSDTRHRATMGARVILPYAGLEKRVSVCFSPYRPTPPPAAPQVLH